MIIDTDDIRKIVVIDHSTGTIIVRTMTSQQADLTWQQLRAAQQSDPGPTALRFIDVTENCALEVDVTAEAAAEILADVRIRRAHPAL
ncbi:hypothetical protein ACFFMN_33830 [Planobispora siamensis]|uniref:Uncharacterized protein n=1 Tax=Planobispora siamensis TaxID=936338 RepID=A0A8J3WJS4_9ACTN|nr:hypothetical protein [Planobispora siamensis]GIH91968.1 hypothetical protein Psi01_25980 [Planobispora siamensis]